MYFQRLKSIVSPNWQLLPTSIRSKLLLLMIDSESIWLIQKRIHGKKNICYLWCQLAPTIIISEFMSRKSVYLQDSEEIRKRKAGVLIALVNDESRDIDRLLFTMHLSRWYNLTFFAFHMPHLVSRRKNVKASEKIDHFLHAQRVSLYLLDNRLFKVGKTLSFFVFLLLYVRRCDEKTWMMFIHWHE
jgi:hypothetical protein